MLDADEIWRRICALEGEFFKTAKGQFFTYRIEQDHLLPSHSEDRIPRDDFAKAFPMLPLADPRKIAKYVTGYHHLHAVLHDERVRRDDW